MQMAITATAFVALTVLSVSIFKRRDSDVEALPYYEALASWDGHSWVERLMDVDIGICSIFICLRGMNNWRYVWSVNIGMLMLIYAGSLQGQRAIYVLDSFDMFSEFSPWALDGQKGESA